MIFNKARFGVMLSYPVHLIVNGKAYDLKVEVWETLLDVLRDRLDLTGTKKGCEKGDCGACTVLLNGEAVNSCLVLALQVDGEKVLTIEGLAPEGDLHPIQEAFIEHGAVQCGYCTPGMILSAKAFLDQNPFPSRQEILKGISGNLCRCTGYVQIIEAIRSLIHKGK
jgi:carbon-monoxide dehydrogenase small subunit